jgi:hypothetical protein
MGEQVGDVWVVLGDEDARHRSEYS